MREVHHRRSVPVAGQDGGGLAHDPEKWEPVFGEDHAQTKCSAIEHDAVKHLVHGVPAKVVGEAGCPEPSRAMDQMLYGIMLDG